MTSTQHTRAEDGRGQAHPVAPAPASLAVADRGEHDRTPAAQQMLLGKRARARYEVFSHAGPTAFKRYRRPGLPIVESLPD